MATKKTTTKVPTYTKDGKTYNYTYGDNAYINSAGTGSALQAGTLLRAGTEQADTVNLLKNVGVLGSNYQGTTLTPQAIELARQYAGVQGTNNTLGNKTLNAIIAKGGVNKVEEPDPYGAYASQLQSAYAQNLAAQQKMLEQSKQAANATYDNNARQRYINYKQGENKLPEDLSNLGVTGGATESAIIDLKNAYGSQLGANELARNQALAAADQGFAQTQAEQQFSLGNSLADAYYQQAKSKQEQEANEAEAVAASKRQASINAKNNDTHSREVKRLDQGYNSKHWTDSDGIYHYRIFGTPTKKASTSPSKPSGGGGNNGDDGNSKDGYKVETGGGGNGGSSNSNEITPTKQVTSKVVQNTITNTALKTIVKKYNSGKLTKAQANVQLGLAGYKIVGNSLKQL